MCLSAPPTRDVLNHDFGTLSSGIAIRGVFSRRGGPLARATAVAVSVCLTVMVAGCATASSHVSASSARPPGGVPTTCATVPTVSEQDIVWASQVTTAKSVSIGEVLAVVLTVPESSGLSVYPWAPVVDSDQAVLEPVPFPGTPISCATSQSLIGERFAFRAVSAGISSLTASVQAPCPARRPCGLQPLDLTVAVTP